MSGNVCVNVNNNNTSTMIKINSSACFYLNFTGSPVPTRTGLNAGTINSATVN